MLDPHEDALCFFLRGPLGTLVLLAEKGRARGWGWGRGAGGTFVPSPGHPGTRLSLCFLSLSSSGQKLPSSLDQAPYYPESLPWPSWSPAPVLTSTQDIGHCHHWSCLPPFRHLCLVSGARVSQLRVTNTVSLGSAR